MFRVNGHRLNIDRSAGSPSGVYKKFILLPQRYGDLERNRRETGVKNPTPLALFGLGSTDKWKNRLRALVIPLSYLLCWKSVFGIPIVAATSFLGASRVFILIVSKKIQRDLRNAELVKKTK